MGDLQPSSGTDLKLSSELLADCVRDSSERFDAAVPWGWMLEVLCAAVVGQHGAFVDFAEDGAVRVAAELALDEGAREAVARGAEPSPEWLRVTLEHAGRVEAVAWLHPMRGVLRLPRWADLMRPVWAAMIAARRAEAHRRAVEASYRDLFEGAADAVFVSDPSMRFVDANAKACELVGYSREELCALSLGDIIADENLAAQPIARAELDGGVLVRSTRLLKRGDGSVRWVETCARRLPDGRYVAVVRDVQEQRLAAERLRLSEESFRALIEAMPDGILIHRHGVIVYANPGAHALLRLPPDERLEGRPVLSILHPDDRAIVSERMRAMASGVDVVPPQMERFVRSDGTVLHAEAIAMRTVFQGEPAVVAVGRDRTEDLRIRAELAHADRVASVGRLAAGVAHEVNNPLTYVTLHLGAVTSALEAMREGAAPRDDEGLRGVSDALRTVGEGLERVRRMVRDLKVFSRQDDDQAARMDLRETLESALNIASHELIQRVSVVRDYAPLPRVRGIEGRLCQVFLNLFVNAAQATPDDGGTHHLRVRTRHEGGFVRVDVGDDGVGMPSAVMERIFEPFFSTRRGEGGTGLGLSISADIVRAHGGRIEVHSEEGRGSTFSVFLPVAEDLGEDRITPEPRVGSSLPPGRARLLAVDDEPAVLAGVVRALGDELAITTVGSAHDALRLIEGGSHFDAVLCDVLMPGMNGPELLSELQHRWPALAEHTLLMMGGSSRDARRVVGAGRPLLMKPFDVNTLRAAVGRLLENTPLTR